MQLYLCGHFDENGEYSFIKFILSNINTIFRCIWSLLTIEELGRAQQVCGFWRACIISGTNNIKLFGLQCQILIHNVGHYEFDNWSKSASLFDGSWICLQNRHPNFVIIYYNASLETALFYNGPRSQSRSQMERS